MKDIFKKVEVDVSNGMSYKECLDYYKVVKEERKGFMRDYRRWRDNKNMCEEG